MSISFGRPHTFQRSWTVQPLSSKHTNFQTARLSRIPPRAPPILRQHLSPNKYSVHGAWSSCPPSPWHLRQVLESITPSVYLFPQWTARPTDPHTGHCSALWRSATNSTQFSSPTYQAYFSIPYSLCHGMQIQKFRNWRKKIYLKQNLKSTGFFTLPSPSERWWGPMQPLRLK